MRTDTAVPGGNAALHLEYLETNVKTRAVPAETPQESKRLRLSTIAQSVNRLSKLQRKILVAAYRRYAANPGLAPVGTPHGKGDAGGEAPKIGVAHLYNHQAVARYLGCSSHGFEGHGSHFNIKPGRKWQPDTDLSSYRTAQAAISRAFKRLETRGLAMRMEREAFYSSGIYLTQKGIELGHELTGITPVPRNWTPKNSTEARP